MCAARTACGSCRCRRRNRRGRAAHDPAVALPGAGGAVVLPQRGGDVHQPQEPHRAAHVHRTHAAGGESQFRRLRALSPRPRRTDLRLFHPRRGGGRIRHRPGHPRGAVPQPAQHQRGRHRRAQGMSMGAYCSAIVLAPLIGALIAGLFGRQIGRAGAHTAAIGGVAVSTALSLIVFKQIVIDGAPAYNAAWYEWAQAGSLQFSLGFLIDRLSATMMVVVTFVSLLVHVYTIGYMADDPGYQRFFSYISLFTFSMLMLVMSNNFLQLFFGWEAVGLVSYLLIGFWFKRPTAIFANLKAFLVNRVGDFGFLLGIAAVLYFLGTLDYATAFAGAPTLVGKTLTLTQNIHWDAATVICILLFVGAMGKSAQVPLHVWLPDSMEGPTPISALIHAATMVTAGIFMVARMSPLYELSETALSVVLVIGATGALFTGLIGIVQNDIKRVVAYSTLSQLGYMTVALGVSAYAGAVFHLMTHAFFKALLFLGAGSVIIAMHHEQDMRYMGGLRKYMPITWVTMWIGSLALVA